MDVRRDHFSGPKLGRSMPKRPSIGPLKRSRRWGWLCACSVLSVGCSGEEEDLRVGVASSLEPAMPALRAAFKSETGKEITWSSGPSARLVNQADAGAPVDVLVVASAAPQTGLSSVVGHNAVVEVRRGGASEAAPIVVAEPAVVPLGAATRTALSAEGRWSGIEAQAIYAASAAQAVAWLRAGEADTGFVYASDVPRLGAGWVVEPLGAEVDYVVQVIDKKGEVFADWLIVRGIDAFLAGVERLPAEAGQPGD